MAHSSEQAPSLKPSPHLEGRWSRAPVSPLHCDSLVSYTDVQHPSHRQATLSHEYDYISVDNQSEMKPLGKEGEPRTSSVARSGVNNATALPKPSETEKPAILWGPDAEPTGVGLTAESSLRKCKASPVISNTRQPPARLPRPAVRLLEEWLLQHRQSPYATQHQQDDLKARTGLKRSQIRNWFANARKRGKIRSLQLSPKPSQIHHSYMPPTLFSQIEKMHPFERWLHLGPEHEAASPSAIHRAVVAEQAQICSPGSVVVDTIDSEDVLGLDTNWQYVYRSGRSASSLEIRSYAANAKSVSSDQWKHTDEPTPPLIKSARRHRRQDVRSDIHVASANAKQLSYKFQCTFCNDCFKTKHDWQRHEKSQHLPLEKWVCCAQGSVNVDTATNEITCVFCGKLDPEPDHIHDHGYTRCISRPSKERSFYRKDHLRQHLRLMHNNCPMLPSMEAWRTATTELRSRCGFCEAELSTWAVRVKHISDHFHSGARMVDWEGDWGFHPDVMAVLERYTLPAARESLKNQKSATRQPADIDGSVASDNWTGLDLSDTWNENEAIDDQSTAQVSAYFDNRLWDTFDCNSSLRSSFAGPFGSLNSLDGATFYTESVMFSDDGLVQDWASKEMESGAGQQLVSAYSGSESFLTSTNAPLVPFHVASEANTGMIYDAASIGGVADFDVGIPLFPDNCLGDESSMRRSEDPSLLGFHLYQEGEPFSWPN